jgi:mannose-1-phosphate guanylyltransferase
LKAAILAAGKGERLGKLTRDIPKPMIKVQGKPILEHNIDLCRSFNIREIYINVHHLGTQISDYFEDGSRFGVKIQYSVEDELLGTAGAVKTIAKRFWVNDVSEFNNESLHSKAVQKIDPFFVIYGDNFSNYNLKNILDRHSLRKPIATIGFHYREDVSTSGVAEFDKSDKIIKFIEKPRPGETNSHWVNAGIYFLEPAILDHIQEGYSDFARNVFPDLLSMDIPVYGVCDTADVKAFDTPEMLKKNLK